MTTSMLAQEHIGYVNAVQFADGSRTSATVQAALNFIGSNPAVLLLAKTGDGIWTLNTALVFPVNVVVLLPAGVVLGGSGNLTFQGQVKADNSAFYTGTGVLTFAPAAPFVYFNKIFARALALNTTSTPLAQLHVSGDVATPATVLVEQRTLGAGNAGMHFYSNNAPKAFFGLVNAAGGENIQMNMLGGGSFLIGGGSGMTGINTPVPLGALHISGDASFPAVLRLEEKTPAAGGAVLSWWSAGTKRGEIGLPGTQDVTLQLSSGARFIVNGGNVGIGLVPTVQFELSGSIGQKLSGSTWSNPSDSRIKTIQRPFTDGLALIQQFESYWVKFNGLAGTPSDGPEFVAPLAQEVQVYAPYMVGSYETKLNPEDETDTEIFNFDASTLMYALVNAVKEQQAQIEALTARVAALEAA